MKLIIAGSRTLRPTMEDITTGIATLRALLPPDLVAQGITEVVSGEADGPDVQGREWALREGVAVHREPVTAADYKEFGSYLGPKMRSRRMAQRGDALLAFWDGKSGGTSDMVCRMVARGKPVIVVPMAAPKREKRR